MWSVFYTYTRKLLFHLFLSNYDTKSPSFHLVHHQLLASFDSLPEKPEDAERNETLLPFTSA